MILNKEWISKMKQKRNTLQKGIVFDVFHEMHNHLVPRRTSHPCARPRGENSAADFTSARLRPKHFGMCPSTTIWQPFLMLKSAFPQQA